ncbi:MAG: hypothetical protein E6661_07535 [Enterobacter sp.]|nr:hypothetical protein [Enterobacter sp.]MDU6058195.1 hypothetical protein [Enterobacter sp.]
MFGNLGEAKKYLGQAAKMLIGIPDYRQEARYGGSGEGGVRCC